MRRNYYFATWLRAFSAILILLCHYMGESSNLYIHHIGEIFSIGVSCFLILSGFLFGTQQNKFEGDIWIWYKKRLKRIYIPLIIFVAILLTVYLIQGEEISIVNWLVLASGMKGFHGGIKGAGHTWFVTAILLCYFATPLIAKLNRWIARQPNKKIIAIFAAGGGYNPCSSRFDSDRICFHLGGANHYI